VREIDAPVLAKLGFEVLNVLSLVHCAFASDFAKLISGLQCVVYCDPGSFAHSVPAFCSLAGIYYSVGYPNDESTNRARQTAVSRQTGSGIRCLKKRVGIRERD